MYKHVVIGIDFSVATEALLEQVTAMPGIPVERVTLVHVLATRYPMTAEETHRTYYEERLSTQATELAARSGRAVDSVVRAGEPASELLDEVATRGADLLMIGNPRHGRLQKMLLGSTAAEVLRLTTAPVWLQPPESASCVGCEDTVLLLTDGSPGVRGAESAMSALASGFRRSVILTVDGRSPEIDQHLDALAETIPGVQIRRETGEARARALGEVEALCPGLVIVGKNRRGYLASLAMGSTAEAICTWARRPVLMVP